MTTPRRGALVLLTAVVVTLAAACSPTVKLEAPDKPITINLNVKVEQEVRVRVEKDIDDLVAKEPELFK
jgi:hypothetical protein